MTICTVLQEISHNKIYTVELCVSLLCPFFCHIIPELSFDPQLIINLPSLSLFLLTMHDSFENNWQRNPTFATYFHPSEQIKYVSKQNLILR